MGKNDVNSRAQREPYLGPVNEESEDGTDRGQGDPLPEGAKPDDSELRAAQEQIDKLKDQHLRTCAELENVRKRGERDVEAARKYGIERFASELLGVRDSLELGLAAAREEDADFKKVHEGIEITERMLVQAMEKFGVELLEPDGQPFNPEYHEAMSTHETADQPPNTVVEVVQKGYILNGRLLRPAMVVVSRAGGADDKR